MSNPTSITAITRHIPENGRWYGLARGVPALITEIPLKTDPTRRRAPNRGDAKKSGGNLLPSWTYWTKDVLRNRQLEKYGMGQLLQSALTAPRHEWETDEAFIVRVMEESKEHLDDMAEIGKQFHEDVNRWLNNGEQPQLPMSFKALPKIDAWLKAHGFDNGYGEVAFLNHTDGYAGTVDRIISRPLNREVGDGGGVIGLLDWKTRSRNKDGKLPKPYESDVMQLAGYARAVKVAEHIGIGPAAQDITKWRKVRHKYQAWLVVIDRDSGDVEFNEVTEQLPDAWEMSVHLLRAWQIRVGYAPNRKPLEYPPDHRELEAMAKDAEQTEGETK